MTHTNTGEVPERQLRQTAVSGSRFVPMLFSTPMVQAILNGTKTETRRIIKKEIPINSNKFPNITPNWKMEFHDTIERFARLKHIYQVIETESGDKNIKSFYHYIKCPIVVIDIIWVRETFYAWGKWVKNGISKTGKQKYIFIDLTLKKDNRRYHYLTDDDFDKKLLRKNNNSEKENIEGWYKRNSLFMPKSAARIFLKVVFVSVERLHDIDEQSAINEGIERLNPDGLLSFRSYAVKYDACVFPIVSYQTLWQKINGKESWDLNPFVWVYKFQRIDEPYGFR